MISFTGPDGLKYEEVSSRPDEHWACRDDRAVPAGETVRRFVVRRFGFMHAFVECATSPGVGTQGWWAVPDGMSQRAGLRAARSITNAMNVRDSAAPDGSGDDVVDRPLVDDVCTNFVVIDGMFSRELASGPADSDRAAALHFHGHALTAGAFESTLAHLAQARRATAPDMPGFGCADAVTVHPLDAWERFIRGYISLRAGDGPLIARAHSAAAPGLGAAARDPHEQLKRVQFVCPAKVLTPRARRLNSRGVTAGFSWAAGVVPRLVSTAAPAVMAWLNVDEPQHVLRAARAFRPGFANGRRAKETMEIGRLVGEGLDGVEFKFDPDAIEVPVDTLHGAGDKVVQRGWMPGHAIEEPGGHSPMLSYPTLFPEWLEQLTQHGN